MIDKAKEWFKGNGRKAESEDDVTEEDRAKHEQYAGEIERDLKAIQQNEGESFEDFRQRVQTKAQQLEQEYQVKLTDGIKIEITLLNSVQEDVQDEDIDIKIRIAPNATENTLEIDGSEGNEVDFSKLKIVHPTSKKEVSVRKEHRKNVHVGNYLLDNFIQNELQGSTPTEDDAKQTLIDTLEQMESGIELITRADATGTIKDRENHIIRELTAISNILYELSSLENVTMPPTPSYVENGSDNSISLLHKGNLRSVTESPSGTSPEWKFLNHHGATGRGNKDFMRMHLNYAKLGGSNNNTNWVVAPQWTNKAPAIQSIEQAAHDYIKADDKNVIWYKAKVTSFYSAEEEWKWEEKSLNKFPETVSYSFGKYTVQDDGETWEEKSQEIGSSGSVHVPKLSLAEHNLPSILVPSKTDWFTNNTSEGKAGLEALGITKDHVNMMQGDGVRSVYSDFATLKEKLVIKYGDDREDEIDDLIDSLTEALEDGLLRW